MFFDVGPYTAKTDVKYEPITCMMWQGKGTIDDSVPKAIAMGAYVRECKIVRCPTCNGYGELYKREASA